MGNYVHRPEPGRQIERIQVVERIERAEPQKAPEINIEALANALAKAMGGTISATNLITTINQNNAKKDSFDDSKTMEQLAASMIVQRGSNESNFDDLGNTKKTKRDVEEVNKTIDILSNLND